jgi:hypothetical protein
MIPKQECRSKQIPWGQIRHLLELWWDDVLNSSTRKRQDRRLVGEFGGTVFDIQPAVSSTQAIGALVALEPLLGFKASTDVLRREGYDSRTKFVNELCSRLKAEAKNRNAQIVGTA